LLGLIVSWRGCGLTSKGRHFGRKIIRHGLSVGLGLAVVHRDLPVFGRFLKGRPGGLLFPSEWSSLSAQIDVLTPPLRSGFISVPLVRMIYVRCIRNRKQTVSRERGRYAGDRAPGG
jgi:hypothetical protein